MITELGYKRRTYADILQEKIGKAQELFGADINTDENTPLGKYIRINAYDQAHVEEIAESVYYSIFPQSAMGTTLDRLGWTVGITRNPSTKAVYEVEITGTANSAIAKGFKVCTETGITFENESDAIIGSNGKCTITVMCTETGEIGNVAPSYINKTVNPSATIDTVKGLTVVSAGEARESDYNFRTRYEVAREGLGSCNEASIRASIIDIPTVEDAVIVADETNHSFCCYVDGGVGYEQQIAEAIFDKKPIGAKTTGDIAKMVSYGALTDCEIRFSHTGHENIYCKITVTTNEKFGTDGNTTIKNNIESYIAELGIGVPVYLTALYGSVYSVTGVVSATIQISTDNKDWSITEVVPSQNYSRIYLQEVTINGEVVG